jgi:hypothetical protein
VPWSIVINVANTNPPPVKEIPCRRSGFGASSGWRGATALACHFSKLEETLMKRPLLVSLLVIGLFTIAARTSVERHRTEIGNQSMAACGQKPHAILIADGEPPPPIPPKRPGHSVILSETDSRSTRWLTADGEPPPPPRPPKKLSFETIPNDSPTMPWLTADGEPPPPPRPWTIQSGLLTNQNASLV